MIPISNEVVEECVRKALIARFSEELTIPPEIIVTPRDRTSDFIKRKQP